MFSNVVAGVDGRAGGRDAIALTKLLAEPGGRLALVHLYNASLMLGGGSALALAADRDASERLLALEREDASLNAELMTCAATSVGRGLHDVAERENADLLVVGSRNRGPLGRVLLSDDTQASLNRSPCAVAIAPRGYAEKPNGLVNIGVGYDGSPESTRALGAARALAARHGSAVRALAVLSIQDIPYGEPIHDNWPEFAKQLVDDEPNHLNNVDNVTGDATYGHPGEELARFSGELDLLVVGSRGYGPLRRIFDGSTANYLARQARCPLLVLPRGAAMEDQPVPPASADKRSRAASSGP